MRGSDYVILLAEDEANDVFLIRRAFTKAKLANPIQVVCDGQTAIQYLAGEKDYHNRERFPLPVLLLLDLKLPRKNGLEVLAWLRSQPPPLRRLPVVILTSSKESLDVNRAYDLGANSYLVKPVDFEGLLRMVEELEMYWLIFNTNPEIV